MNADVYCECDFARLMNIQLGERLAHLVLVPNPSHRSKGDFSLADGRLGDAAAPRYTYAGVAVVAPKLVQSVNRGEKAPLAPLLRRCARGLLGGEVYGGLWQDVGTMERLAELERFLNERR